MKEQAMIGEKEQAMIGEHVTPVARREAYVKPEAKAQPLDEVVRGGGGNSGDQVPGQSGGPLG